MDRDTWCVYTNALVMASIAFAMEATSINSAKKIYFQACKQLLQCYKRSQLDDKHKLVIKSKMESFLSRAETLNESNKNTISSQITQHYSHDDFQLLLNAIRQPRITMDQIAGLQQTKDILKELVQLPLMFPSLFLTKCPVNSLLLCGVSLMIFPIHTHVANLASRMWKINACRSYCIYVSRCYIHLLFWVRSEK
jgi:SpoVK/Ycf46/Vps4 family AAA+-type ATPase